MRLLFLMLAILAFDIYVFQAFISLSQNWDLPAKSVLYLFYWSLPLLAILLLLAPGSWQNNASKRNAYISLRAIVMIAYMCKLLIAGGLLIDDIRRAIFKVYAMVAGTNDIDMSRSKFLFKASIAISAIPFFTLIYGMLRNRHRYTIFSEKLSIKNLPTALQGLKIVQISDVHSGSFTKKGPVKLGIDLINAQQADLVFFTGDLVNNMAKEMDPFIDIFDKIESRYGVFSILGNHDYGDYVSWKSEEAKRQNLEQLKMVHKKLGWKLLVNEHKILNIEGAALAIIGVENWSASMRFPKHGRLDDAYRGSENADVKLLLSHDPSHWIAEVTERYPDIDITFSGHTHGMQFGIEIPGWIKWSPAKYVYKQWAGLYQKGHQYLYVNRGFGYIGYPGRVGILPEITVIELERAG